MAEGYNLQDLGYRVQKERYDVGLCFDGSGGLSLR